MTDLSQRFRERLAAHTAVRRTEVEEVREDEGGTRAFLLRLRDGRRIETVLIPEGDRNTVCVSTQVGCAIACVFCASGMKGLDRNLSPGEIVEQVLVVQDALPKDASVSNVVVMGIGEPTMNRHALRAALERWNDPQAVGLGARRITISTVGFPARIRELAELGPQFQLAISLHAADPALRARLLPGAARVPLGELLEAAKYYWRTTSRRVTFEYVLLADVNDAPEHARSLVNLLRGFPCLINLIPVNPVAELGYSRPSPTRIAQFRAVLEAAGLAVKQRKTRGDDISAACGQLRLRRDEERATS